VSSITIGAWPTSFNVTPGQQLSFYTTILAENPTPPYFAMSVGLASEWVKAPDGSWQSLPLPDATPWVSSITPATFSLPAYVSGTFYPEQGWPYGGNPASCGEPMQYVATVVQVPAAVPPATYGLVLLATEQPDPNAPEGSVSILQAVGMTFTFVVASS